MSALRLVQSLSPLNAALSRLEIGKGNLRLDSHLFITREILTREILLCMVDKPGIFRATVGNILLEAHIPEPKARLIWEQAYYQLREYIRQVQAQYPHLDAEQALLYVALLLTEEVNQWRQLSETMEQYVQQWQEDWQALQQACLNALNPDNEPEQPNISPTQTPQKSQTRAKRRT